MLPIDWNRVSTLPVDVLDSLLDLLTKIANTWKKCFSIQFTKLEGLKYRCLAFGFCVNDVQVVTTSDCTSCASARCLEYLHALTAIGTSAQCVRVVFTSTVCAPASHHPTPTMVPESTTSSEARSKWNTIIITIMVCMTTLCALKMYQGRGEWLQKDRLSQAKVFI